MNIFTQLRQEWHATAPEHLLNLPVTVLKVVDEARAAVLGEVLGVHTVREMATQPLVDWVWRTYSLFRAGVQKDLPPDAAEHVTEAWLARSCGDWLASPISSLRGLSAEELQRLGDAVGWVNVRQVANDAAFATAREIHRIVTGKPVPPEETVVKPLPDYFAGSSNRFMNRAREAAGLPQRPPPAPVPPPPPPPPPAPPRAPERSTERAAQRGSTAPELRVEPDAVPAAQAGLHPFGSERAASVPAHHHKDYTPDGTYIPKGGGSRGWLENQGVARAERANRYRYQEVVDVTRFKRAGLEEQVRVNNRGSERKELRMQVRWALDAAANPMPGLCLNLSLTGAKLRLGQQPREGTPLRVTWVHRDELLGAEKPVLHLSATSVWCRPGPPSRAPRYDCGIHFDPMELAAQERLTLLLTDRLERLLQMEPPPGLEAPEAT